MMRFQQEALNLRAQRQSIIAANIVNADTPGYQARDIDFSTELSKALTQGRASGETLALTTTSAAHIAGASKIEPTTELLYRIPDQPAMDGNTVNMDRERTAFADNSLQYQTGLTLLGGQIKGMNSVLQGQ
ncbi:Flagellar basal body rod protein FlgB [Sodalis glossinidius str. 'morsitans']|uniref:Flagellar basal body rod protein FlgB n=2 Tax=Sodalis glossinidius TaxID=63612 RepID=Q2NR90_SODGM|nr:flagellar basal-body rod protein FlgB [Sodalis glossinidius str. 'morsitans']CRL46353.1 Flagellar basal body rod protein FlgB [Sodalis glossinidius str. 'morsitans']